MNEEIKELIGSLKTSLQDYTGGKVSFGEAKNAYKKLLSKYNSIRNGIDTGREDSVLRGICYHHNIENFSLFSGLYRLGQHQVTPVLYYGEHYFNKCITDSFHKILESITSSHMASIPAGTVKGLPHDIHVFSVMDSGSSILVFIAISSSLNFNERKFVHAGTTLGKIIGKILPEVRLFQFNYYSLVKHDLEQYISHSILDGYFIDGRLFVCNMLEKIFFHMGLNALLEISNQIVRTLQEKYGPDSKVYTLSLGEYIVLVKSRQQTPGNGERKKVELVYKSITIPYQTLNLRVNSKDELYEFWQSVFSFSHYIHFGDIQK